RPIPRTIGRTRCDRATSSARESAIRPSRRLPARFAVSQEVHVETAIGVFDSQDKAGEALRDLIRHNVPREYIVFLTRSENEAVTVAEELGAYAGGFINEGFLAKVTAVMPLIIPGTGPVHILGSGASAWQRLLSRGTGAALDKATSTDVGIPETSPDNENVALFQMILRSGRSIILVRTAWHEIAT